MFNVFMLVAVLMTNEGMLVKNIPFETMEQCQQEKALVLEMINQEQLQAGVSCTKVEVSSNI